MIYIANELSSNGYIVDLIVHDGSGVLAELVSRDVNIIVLKNSVLYDVFFLSNYIKKKKPVHVISSMHVPNWTLSLGKILSFRPAKISWRVVTNVTASSRRSLVKLVACKLFYPLLSRSVSSVVCVSKGVADDVSRNFHINNKKIKVIYNPAYTENIHDYASERLEHPWFNNSMKVIVAVGRLSIEKDLQTLISSFSLVVSVIPMARLVIVGDGPIKNDLVKDVDTLGLQNHVDFVGFDINPYKYIGNADVFVLSSRNEGFGNVIVEALALNVPVVSTDCPSGPSEILGNGKWGELVPVADPQKMADAIISTIRENRKKSTLVRARDFSLSYVVKEYEKIF